MNTSSFTNIVVVTILVLLVGFGVWYFTSQKTPTQSEQGSGFELNINGSGGENPGQDGSENQ